MRVKNVISLEEAKERIYSVHGNQLKIVEETYISFSKKCEFEDIEYGSWISTPGSIFRGTTHPIRVSLKRKQTCINNFGEDNIFKTQKFKDNLKEKMIENYGVDNFFKSIEGKSKSQSKETQEKRNAIIRNKTIEEKKLITFKRAQTTFLRHGYYFPFENKEIQNKTNLPEAREKAFKTMKHNGFLVESKVENNFYNFLIDIFKNENVIHHIRINKWSIDFYIKSKDLYIQFDGVYYHGLDRPFNELSPNIKKTYLKDIDQVIWFKKNNLKFIRINEDQFNNSLEEVKLIFNSL